MTIIKIDNLTFAYPGSYQNVLENCSLQIDTRWRLGFIGRNGRGKTTLLRLLCGDYAYSGRIISSVQFAYFPPPLKRPDRSTLTILTEIAPAAETWQLEREFGLLKLSSELLERPFSTLSGGEQTKALLAAFFLNEGHFPLLDEPTNHLDAAGRVTVAEYLRRKPGYILVSHDRRFLDGCVDHILALNRTGIDVQRGNFSAWYSDFQRREAYEQTQHDRLQREIGHLQQAAKQSAGWSDRIEKSKYGQGPVDRGYIGHRSAKMMQRAKAIAARRDKAIAEKSALLHNTETAEKLILRPLPHHSQRLAKFENAAVLYGGRTVNRPLLLEICQGERIALAGGNGSGKTSLLKLLCGEPLNHTGSVKTASNLIISYIPQDTSHLRGRLTDFIHARQIDATLFRTILRKLAFSRAEFDQDLSALSAGQKKKILLAASLCEQAHLYIWDEPLNYIDVFSRMQIEELLLAYQPTMLFVEHDQAFRDLIATRQIEL